MEEMEQWEAVEIEKIPLKEQTVFQELFAALEKHGLHEEKDHVMQMADYLDGMEEQLGNVLKELRQVRDQLDTIQNRGMKQKALEVVKRAEQMVQGIGRQVAGLKEQFIQRAKQAVQASKEKGKEALVSAVRKLYVPETLKRLQNALHDTVLYLDQGIDRIGNVGDELQEAKGHLKNIAKELSGKERTIIRGRNPERGVTFQLQKAMFSLMQKLHRMEQKTGELRKQLEPKEQGEKTSVKARLEAIQNQRVPLAIEMKQPNYHYLSGSGMRGVS